MFLQKTTFLLGTVSLLLHRNPVRDVLLGARKIDADFENLFAVHLEASGVVFQVDLVEGCLCVFIYFELKDIDVIIVDEDAVGSTFGEVRFGDYELAQYGEHQVNDVLKITLRQFCGIVVGVWKSAEKCFEPFYDTLDVGVPEVFLKLGVVQPVGFSSRTVKLLCKRQEKAQFDLIIWKTERI